MTSTKHSGHEVNQCIKEIRGQIVEQVRALESRSEVENAILCDISDFLKKRAEIEAEYSSKLDKLAKSAMLKHKNEKTKFVFFDSEAPKQFQFRRQNWPMFTICSLWQQLVDHTKEEARQRAVTVDVFGTQIPQAIASRVALNAKVTKKVKEIVVSEHGDVHRVLEELCKSMSNYHKLFAAANSAKHKLQAAEAEKQKNEKSTKKQKALNKQLEKFEAARAQCNRSRNEYLLCIEAANAALYQYYANDLSDFIDCTNVGYEFWVNMVLTNIIAARKAVCQQEMNSLANLSSFRESFDTDFDKHRFFESNSSIFQLPKPFEFKRDAGEQIGHIITASPLGEELELRRNQIKKRLEVITKESEQCLVDLEQQTNHLKTLISTSVLLEITPEGLQDNRPQKEITDRSIEETCSVYIDIFRRHLLNGNLISRLESRILAIDNAIKSNDFGVDRNLSLTGTQSPMFSEELCQRLRIKKRASSTNDYSPENPFSNKKPKLFGGSLEEYLNATGEQIPCVVSSCIRVLSQHGLHHQGLFRISGSTNEINLMKEAFENGDDPLINVSSPSDMNSVACVLKCYFRELREPLFPVCLFDQFTACAKSIDFVVQILPLMSKLSRGRYLVLRYLFAFLNDLSHYSDENMMDSSNLAICFGPTLLPTPEDKNQVYYQSLVNDLVRNLIEKYDQVFSPDIPGPKYHVFDDGIAFADDGEEPFGTMTTESEFGVNNLFSFTSQLMTNSFHGLPSEHNGLPGRDKRIAAAAAAIVQNRRSMYGDSSNGVMSPIMMSFEDGDERRVLSPKTTKTINSNSIAPISASSSAGRTSLSGESTSSSNNQKENGVVSTNDSPTKKGTIIKSISVLQERVSIDNGSLSTTVNVQPIQDKSPVLPSTSSNSNQSISANSGRIRVPGKMRSTALTAQITYEDKDDSANSTPSHAIFSNGKTTPISSASSSSSPRILSAFSGSTSEEQLLDNSYAVEVNHKSQHV